MTAGRVQWNGEALLAVITLAGQLVTTAQADRSDPWPLLSANSTAPAPFGDKLTSEVRCTAGYRFWQA